MSDTTGAPPPHHDKLSERLRQLPVFVAALTALITAIAAFRKPPDTTASKAGYEELSRVIEEVSKASVKNHEDIVRMHAYLQAYADVLSHVKQNDATAKVAVVPEAGADSPPRVRPSRRTPEPTPAAPTPAPAARMELPPVIAEPRLVVPQKFNSVVQQAMEQKERPPAPAPAPAPAPPAAPIAP